MKLNDRQRELIPWKRALVQAEMRRRQAVETCALLAEVWAEENAADDAQRAAAKEIAALIRELGDDPDEALRAQA